MATGMRPLSLSSLFEEAVMSKARTFATFIDRMNELIGKMVSYLVVPLTLIVVYEVMMRYVFDAQR